MVPCRECNSGTIFHHGNQRARARPTFHRSSIDRASFSPGTLKLGLRTQGQKVNPFDQADLVLLLYLLSFWHFHQPLVPAQLPSFSSPSVSSPVVSHKFPKASSHQNLFTLLATITSNQEGASGRNVLYMLWFHTCRHYCGQEQPAVH